MSTPNNLNYAPGLPGYGVIGNDGSTGLNGISLYFSSLNGKDDVTTIKYSIENNYNLDGIGINIPGYELGRVYQTGDYFIDIASIIYKIDLSTDNRYIDTGISINTFGLFQNTQVKDVYGGYNRYINSSSTIARNIIDTVYTKNPDNYQNSPINTYGVLTKNFAKIFFNDLPDETSNNNAFIVFTSGNSSDNALALVRNAETNTFRLGNVDPSGFTRNVNLQFDVKNLIVNRNDFDDTLLNENSSVGNILTTREINAPRLFKLKTGSSFNTEGFNIVSTSNSITATWDKSKLLETNDTNIIGNTKADIVVYKNISVASGTFNITDNVQEKLVFEDIDNSGSITINNLVASTRYNAYLKLNNNGWLRTTPILTVVTGQIPTLTLTDAFGVAINNGDTINVFPYISGGIANQKSIYVKTNNGAWSVTSSDSFVTSDNNGGSGDGYTVLTIKDNNLTSVRRANIKIYSNQNPNIYVSFVISQAAFTPSLSVTPTDINIVKDGSINTLNITSTTQSGPWSVSSNNNWITTSYINSSIGNGNVQINVGSNSGEKRSGSVVIALVNYPNYKSTIQINQESGVQPLTYNVSSSNVVVGGDNLGLNVDFKINLSRAVPTPVTVKAKLYFISNIYNDTMQGASFYTNPGISAIMNEYTTGSSRIYSLRDHVLTPSDTSYSRGPSGIAPNHVNGWYAYGNGSEIVVGVDSNDSVKSTARIWSLYKDVEFTLYNEQSRLIQAGAYVGDRKFYTGGYLGIKLGDVSANGALIDSSGYTMVEHNWGWVK